MDNYQKIESKANKGMEFLKIYGITLVVAFLLTTVVQHHLGTSDILTEVMPEPPTVQMQPIAEADKLFPLKKLIKIFVNLSF